MLSFFLRRLLYMIVLLIVLSVVVFTIIQLPPGDYATAYINQMRLQGTRITEEDIQQFQRQYGLDLPIHRQYLKWVGGLARGYMGRSFFWNEPINQLLAERLPLTVVISVCTLVFTYVVAVPIGIYSATHQYSVFDYVFTVIGFVGVALPNFLFALIMLFVLYEIFGISAGGLFSKDYVGAAWSWGKVRDLINHLWAPVIIIGTSGTGGLIRVMRATMLDELSKPYVETARQGPAPDQAAAQVPGARGDQPDLEHDRLDVARHLFRVDDRRRRAGAAYSRTIATQCAPGRGFLRSG